MSDETSIDLAWGAPGVGALVPSGSYFAEKAFVALDELSTSRRKLGERLENALVAFLRVPRSGLPEPIADLVKEIDDLTLRYPEILREKGDDFSVGGKKLRDFGHLKLNYGTLGWRAQDALAGKLLRACVEIVAWGRKGAEC